MSGGTNERPLSVAEDPDASPVRSLVDLNDHQMVAAIGQDKSRPRERRRLDGDVNRTSTISVYRIGQVNSRKKPLSSVNNQTSGEGTVLRRTGV